MPLYDMSKAGVIGLMRSLANGYGKEGIRVNAICPGVTVTEFHEKKAAKRGHLPEELRASIDGTRLIRERRGTIPDRFCNIFSK